MIHSIEMGDDAILRISFNGNLGRAEIDAFAKDFSPYVDASTAATPLKALIDAKYLGKLSSAARHAFTDMNRDLRIGYLAVYSANRQMRVFLSFLLKATNRENIRLFDQSDEAIKWLKNL